jgi:hypothetical protein
LLSLGSSELETEALTAEEEIHDTGVGDGREALFLLKIVANVSDISLNTRSGNHKLPPS